MSEILQNIQVGADVRGALAVLEEADVRTLADELATASPDVRAAALRELGASGCLYALDATARFYRDADVAVRRAALQVALDRGGDSSYPAQVAMRDILCSDPDDPARGLALSSLLMFRHSEETVALLRDATGMRPEHRARVEAFLRSE